MKGKTKIDSIDIIDYSEGDFFDEQEDLFFGNSNGELYDVEGNKVRNGIEENEKGNKKEIPVVKKEEQIPEKEVPKEKGKEYYTVRGKKEKKEEKKGNNYRNDGDKDDNNPYMYWSLIKRDNRFVCFRGEEMLYWFDPNTGIYKLNAESLLKEISQKISNESLLGMRRNHAVELVELAKRDTMREKPSEDEYKYILLVGNGIITIKDKNGKMVFTPNFNSNYFIMSGVPWNYNPKAKCPKIKRFLIELIVDIKKCNSYINTDQLWENLTLEEKSKVLTLVEFAGYCLLRSCDLKKFLILKGGKDSGKSKYTDLVEKALGHDSCSAISLQEMRHEYNVAEIYGKMANIRGELSDKNLEDTSIIKIFVNGDPVQGRIIRSRPIRFRPFAKLIFATNVLPATSSTEDDSFYGKIILIDCPNRFKRDDTFFDRITPKEEMEGFLVWMLESLKNALRNMRFSHESDWEKVARRFPRYTKGARYDTE